MDPPLVFEGVAVTLTGMPAQTGPAGCIEILIAGAILAVIITETGFEFAVLLTRHEPPVTIIWQVMISPFASVVVS